MKDDPKEMVNFWRGWKGLYLVVILFGILQVGLLVVFTVLFNRP